MRYKLSLFAVVVLLAVAAPPAQGYFHGYEPWLVSQYTTDSPRDQGFHWMQCGESANLWPGQEMRLSGPEWTRWSIGVFMSWSPGHIHPFYAGVTFGDNVGRGVVLFDGEDYSGNSQLRTVSKFNPVFGPFVRFEHNSGGYILIVKKRCT